MKNEFTVKIELGSTYMCEPADVARALEELASMLRDMRKIDSSGGSVQDKNENGCGTWSWRSSETIDCSFEA